MSLAREVVDNAFVDLNPNGNESGDTSASVKSRPSAEASLRPSHRKRKHAATTGSFEEWHDKSNSELGALKNHSPTLFTLRIAALEALEALLTMVRSSIFLIEDFGTSCLVCLYTIHLFVNFLPRGVL